MLTRPSSPWANRSWPAWRIDPGLQIANPANQGTTGTGCVGLHLPLRIEGTKWVKYQDAGVHYTLLDRLTSKKDCAG